MSVRKINYLPNKKLNLHLKLNREIYQFVGLGEYFESKTFEYLMMRKTENQYAVKLVRALDYQYGFSPSMDEFETVEELEEACESIFTGSFEGCLDWAKKEYRAINDKWSFDVIDIYIGYVEKQILGKSSDHL